MADATAPLASGASSVSATVVSPVLVTGGLVSAPSGLSASVSGAHKSLANLQSGGSTLSGSTGAARQASGGLQSGPSRLDAIARDPGRYRGGDIGSHADLNIALNRSFRKIANALSGAISRDETRPMMDELDMNSHRITGVKSMLDPGCPWVGPVDLEDLNNLATLAGLEDPESLLFCVMRSSIQEQVQSPYYSPGWCETYQYTSKPYPLEPRDGMTGSAGMRDSLLWGIEPEEAISTIAILDGVLRDPIVGYNHTDNPEELEPTAAMLDGVLRNPLITYDHRSEPEELESDMSVLNGTIRVALITYDHTSDPEELEADMAMLDGTLT